MRQGRVLDRGRLVLQERLDALLATTGLVEVGPGRRRCVTLLGEALVTADGDRLLVRAHDSAS